MKENNYIIPVIIIKMQNPGREYLFLIFYICLYFAKSICIIFFTVQVVKYHIITKNKLSSQDKFIRWSFKVMCLAYAAAFVNYTYEFILIVLSIYSNDFLNWAAEKNDLSIKIKFSLISITGILMAICLLYNLARWYLIIKIMKKENEALSKNFRFTIKILTGILALVGISQTTIIIIDSI
jgi:hypothetical protein